MLLQATVAQWPGPHVKEDLRLCLLSREFGEFERSEALSYLGLQSSAVRSCCRQHW